MSGWLESSDDDDMETTDGGVILAKKYETLLLQQGNPFCGIPLTCVDHFPLLKDCTVATPQSNDADAERPMFQFLREKKPMHIRLMGGSFPLKLKNQKGAVFFDEGGCTRFVGFQFSGNLGADGLASVLYDDGRTGTLSPVFDDMVLYGMGTSVCQNENMNMIEVLFNQRIESDGPHEGISRSELMECFGKRKLLLNLRKRQRQPHPLLLERSAERYKAWANTMSHGDFSCHIMIKYDHG
jgi:hypothetical protein